MTIVRHAVLIALFCGLVPAIDLVAAGVIQSGKRSMKDDSPTAQSRQRQPFRNLFPSPLVPMPGSAPRADLFKPLPPGPMPSRRAQVVCGTTVMLMDPKVDSGIRRDVPGASSSVIRGVPPPTCGAETDPEASQRGR